MTLPRPEPGSVRLVTVAHGTRLVRGNRTAKLVTGQAARRLGGLPHTTSYVELCDPLLSSVVESAPEDQTLVVVPLLLSTGYHLRQDLPRAVAPLGERAVLGRALGPHPLIAEVMCHRLLGVGARAGTPVVMVATGSNDPASLADLTLAAQMLRQRWGGPVEFATMGGTGPVVSEVLQRLGPRAVIAPYLLSEGHFSHRLAAIARVTGAKVSPVLGAHPLVAELVARHFRSALQSARAA